MLFVDGDADEAALVAAYLQREGSGVDCRVTTETDPQAALARLRAGESFDCVVSGSMLPGMDGIEFLEAVQAHRPEVPVLLFACNDPSEVAARVVEAGLTDFLTKGYGADQYTMLVRRVGHALETDAGAFDRKTSVELNNVAVIGADERFERVDEGYASLYGYAPSEVEGRHWTDLHPVAEVRHVQSHVLPVVRAGGQWSGRSEGLRADGSTFTESKLVQALSDGRLLVAVSAAEDVVDAGSAAGAERDARAERELAVDVETGTTHCFTSGCDPEERAE